MGTYCIVLLLASLFLVYTMRHLRKQCNEYAMIRKIAMLILLAPVLFLVFGAITGPNNGALRRQMQIFLSVFITGMAFWIPIGQPVWAFVVKNEVSSMAIAALHQLAHFFTILLGKNMVLLFTITRAPHLR